MAHTKALGSTKLGRDSISKRLGIKVNDGQKVMTGQIILRQRGTKYLQGANVMKAGDDTFFAKKNGIVRLAAKTKTKFDGSNRRATIVSVV
jgi:large subunit ribosomal protein L27